MEPIEEKFWSKVDRSSGCWIWQAGKSANGYGAFPYKGKMEGAHRLAWILSRGPIPSGVFVCHNCPGGDNRSCVNPQHLFLGSALDNNRDMIAKGRHWSQAKSHCKRGHELIQAKSQRYCPICRRKASLQWYYDNKAKSLNAQLQCNFL